MYKETKLKYNNKVSFNYMNLNLTKTDHNKVSFITLFGDKREREKNLKQEEEKFN